MGFGGNPPLSIPFKVGYYRPLSLGRRDTQLLLSVLKFVRRAKARFSSGCKSRPATFAPAGSNRSSRGGNEAAGASGVEGHSVTWQVCGP